MGETLILVHPGSFYVSAADQARQDVYEASVEALEGALDSVRHLVVIDGFMSDFMTREQHRAISDALSLCEGRGGQVLRIWGCDAGEAPGADWKGIVPPGRKSQFDSQQEAARAIADLLPSGRIVLAGAWCGGPSPDDGGCVNSVWAALRECGRTDITIGDAVALEEWIDCQNDFEP